MTPVLLGQLLGISFACGLNLYATVAALGLFSRLGLLTDLPAALRGLESAVVIGTALVLYIIEAIIDRVQHADSIWDTVHTFIRPPAAALLAVGAFWGFPLTTQFAAATIAFLIALAAHGSKAGLRLALNATDHDLSTRRISTTEDLAAVAFVFAALEFPATALVAGAIVLAIMIVFGPRLWRAFVLGLRCLVAWFRTLFVQPGWRDADQLPRRLRQKLKDPPLGGAPTRAIRAAVNGLPGVGAYRNGWLVITADGPGFLCNGLLGARRIDIPALNDVELEPGIWLNTLRLHTTAGDTFLLYLLKDGPALSTTVREIRGAA